MLGPEQEILLEAKSIESGAQLLKAVPNVAHRERLLQSVHPPQSRWVEVLQVAVHVAPIEGGHGRTDDGDRLPIPHAPLLGLVTIRSLY